MARSIKKGPFIDLTLMAKVEKTKAAKSKDAIKTWSRRSMIIPDFVGMTFNVHDGKRFIAVHVTESMVGHKLGEFAPTRTFRMHSGQRQAGAGAEK
jgi:small subunit ribosomal protein S19